MNDAIKGIIPFAYIMSRSKAQKVMGCDPGRPFYFVPRNTTNGLLEDGHIFLHPHGLCLFPEPQAINIFVSEQGKVTLLNLDKIKCCAIKHNNIPDALLKYL